MTIDEAIMNAKDIIKDSEETIKVLERCNPNDKMVKESISDHTDRIEECKQYIEWLEELKMYRKLGESLRMGRI